MRLPSQAQRQAGTGGLADSTTDVILIGVTMIAAMSAFTDELIETARHIADTMPGGRLDSPRPVPRRGR